MAALTAVEAAQRTTGDDDGAILDKLRVNWAQFWQDDKSAEAWLLEPVLARGRSHSLTAKAKTGKSEFVLTILTPTVLGRAVLDRPAGEPLRVLYLDYEMTEADVQERLEDMGYGPDDNLEPLAYLLHPPIPPLDTPEGGAAVYKLADEHRADLVVIDTYSRAVQGLRDDNDATRDLYMHTIVPLKRDGITVLRNDHTGHQDQSRAHGASAKGDDVDIGWLMTRPKEGEWDLSCKLLRRVSWVPTSVPLRRLTDPLRVEHVRRVVASGDEGVPRWPCTKRRCLSTPGTFRRGLHCRSAATPTRGR